MEEIATIAFKERETGSDAAAIVKRDADSVALCLTIRNNGDILVVMTREDTRKLLDALQAALA